MPRQSTKRNRSRTGRRAYSTRGSRVPITERFVTTQGDGPSFRGEQLVILDVPCDPFTLSTTVTTGVIAASVVVSQDMVPNFASYAAIFDQYRIRCAFLDVTALANTSGASVFAWDDDNFAVPSEVSIESNTNTIRPNSSANPKSSFRTQWIGRDTQDNALTSTTISTNNVAALKVYTNTATYGAPTTVTALWLIRPILRIEFRGLQQ
jgi:hypothetical protein